MRRKALLTLLFLLPGAALGFSFDSTNTTLMDYRVCGRLTSDGEVNDLGLTLKAYPRVDLVSGSGMNVSSLGGQRVLAFERSSFTGSLDYCYDAELKNSVTINKIPFLLHFPYDDYDEGLEEYLVFGNTTDYSEEIGRIANNVTEGSSSTLEAAARLAAWVSKNMEYDLAYSNEAKNAAWVESNRVGVCEEYTNLFISLCRSAGIPARYVSGYVYSNKSFGPHAWAEAWVGDWVSFDTTYAEFGALDSSHIPFYKSLEHESLVEANYYSSQGVELSSVDPEFTINFAGEESDLNHLESSFTLSKEEANQEDYFFATLTVHNPFNKYLVASFDVIRSCMKEGSGCKPGTEIEVVRGNPSHVVLPPNDSGSASVVFKTPDYGLSNNQYVSGSVGVRGVLVGTKSASIRVSRDAERTSLDEALMDSTKTTPLDQVRITELDLPEVAYGDTVRANYSLFNEGDELLVNATFMSSLTETKTFPLTLPPGEYSGTAELSVTSKALDRVRLVIVSGDAKTESSSAVNFVEKPELAFNVPGEVDLRKDEGINVTVVNENGVRVDSLSITMVNGEPLVKTFHPRSKGFSTVINAGFVEQGWNELMVSFSYEDAYGTVFASEESVRVYKPPFYFLHWARVVISKFFKDVFG